MQHLNKTTTRILFYPRLSIYPLLVSVAEYMNIEMDTENILWSTISTFLTLGNSLILSLVTSQTWKTQNSNP